MNYEVTMNFSYGPHKMRLLWKEHGKLTPSEDAMGSYDPSTKTVELSKVLLDCPVDGFETMLHELMHVVDVEGRGGVGEEKVNLLSFGLAELFIRNPKLFEALVKLWDDACNNKSA
jgi:hypothetical protein